MVPSESSRLLPPEDVYEQSEQKTFKKPRWQLCVFVYLGPMLCGFCIAYTSPTELDMVAEGILTRQQMAWFASLFPLSVLIGGPFAGYCVDPLGRKGAILLACLPTLAGWLLLGYAVNYQMLYTGRILTGLSTGMLSTSVPLYIAEISKKSKRGALCAAIHLTQLIGIQIIFTLGIILTWQWLAIVAVFVVTLLVVAMVFLPETPRWYAMKGRDRAARETLKWLRGSSEDVEKEFLDMQKAIKEDSTVSAFSWRLIFTKRTLKPLVLCCGVYIFSEMCGIAAVGFNTNAIFKEAGFKTNSKEISALAELPSLPGVVIGSLLVDRAGRRPVLITCGVVTVISTMTFGVQVYLKEVQGVTSLAWLSVLSLIVFKMSYNTGWGPIPKVIMSEMFPVSVRGFASGVCVAVNYLCVFIVTNQFLNLTSVLGLYGTFWLFSGIALLGVICVMIFLPETKGLQLEDVNLLFDSK